MYKVLYVPMFSLGGQVYKLEVEFLGRIVIMFNEFNSCQAVFQITVPFYKAGSSFKKKKKSFFFHYYDNDMNIQHV